MRNRKQGARFLPDSSSVVRSCLSSQSWVICQTERLRRAIWCCNVRRACHFGVDGKDRRCVLCPHGSPLHDSGGNRVHGLRFLRQLGHDALQPESSVAHDLLNSAVAWCGIRALARLAEIAMQIKVDRSILRLSGKHDGNEYAVRFLFGGLITRRSHHRIIAKKVRRLASASGGLGVSGDFSSQCNTKRKGYKEHSAAEKQPALMPQVPRWGAQDSSSLPSWSGNLHPAIA
jgi:hypothetical protein